MGNLNGEGRQCLGIHRFRCLGSEMGCGDVVTKVAIHMEL